MIRSPLQPEVQFQQTLKAAIHCTGIGLHSGERVTMTLMPATVDSGLRLIRSDKRGAAAIIPARWDHVVDTRMCTVLGNDAGVTVGTVEHLLAALAGMGVDNAEIHLDGPEIPIMDGSAAPFVFLLECAGLVEQDEPRRAIRLLRTVSVALPDGRSASLSPAEDSVFDVSIAFDSAAIASQEARFHLTDGAFKDEISRARTFGFRHEVEQMQQMGLARGGSLENAIVIDGDQVLNPDGLRYRDEFVRHKILDSVGDLYLAGGPVLGRFRGVRSGHALNNQLLRTLFADPLAWCDGVVAQDRFLPPLWQNPPLAATA